MKISFFKGNVEPVFIHCGLYLVRWKCTMHAVNKYKSFDVGHMFVDANALFQHIKKHQHSGNVSLPWPEHTTFTVCWNYFERDMRTPKKKNAPHTQTNIFPFRIINLKQKKKHQRFSENKIIFIIFANVFFLDSVSSLSSRATVRWNTMAAKERHKIRFAYKVRFGHFCVLIMIVCCVQAAHGYINKTLANIVYQKTWPLLHTHFMHIDICTAFA